MPVLEYNDPRWIRTRFATKCGDSDCGEPVDEGSHALFLPDAPRGRNILCRDCGECVVPYPEESYWEELEGGGR